MGEKAEASGTESKLPGKLTIMAFKTSDFEECIGMFEAQVNPESFDRTLNFSLKTQKTNNKTGQKGEDATADGESYRFELIFDATGVIDGMPKPDEGIKNVLAQFHDIVARKEKSKEPKDADVELRKPNFLKMAYCAEDFLCIISSMSIKYTLFSRSGAPLRARVSCDFKSVGKPALVDKNKEKKKTRKKSQPTNECVCECNGNVEKVVNMCTMDGNNTIHVKD